MSTQITQWFSNELLAIAFNRDTYTPAYTSLQVALTIDQPIINADSTQLLEPAGMGYARMSIPLNTANWVLSGYREITQAVDITFAAATYYWGTVSGWALLTVEATPNTVAAGTLATPLRVITGIQPQIPAGSISLGLY